MEKKARFTVITKILGVFSVLTMTIGFFITDNAHPLLYLDMASFFLGGIFNLLDFGKTSLSITAFIFYSISACLSAGLGLSEGIISPDFIISFIALIITLLRYSSVQKVEQRKKATTSSISVKNEPQAYIVDSSQPKCRVGIMREARSSGSASAFTVYVDGVKTTTIKNGGTTRLILSPGCHVIGFAGIGGKILSSITLNLAPGSDANLMCYARGSGIEVSPTPVDVCSLVEPSQSTQAQSDGSGCLAQIIGLILLFIGLYILGVGLKLFVFIAPVR